MAEYVLYGPAKGNKNVLKAQLAAKYAGVQYSQPPFTFGETNKTPEYLAKNPNGKAPLLDTPTGPVWESNAIARYFARFSDTLFGTTSLETAQIEQWIDFSTTSIDAPLSSWVYPLKYPGIPYDKKKETQAIESVKNGLQVLERHLTQNTYLVGDTITLADVITFANLQNGYQDVFDEAFRSQFPAVTRWYSTVGNQPTVLSVADFKLADKPLKFTPPAKQEAKKKETPKEAEKPATATTTAATAASAPATPPAEDAPKPAAKPKDPLAELPPSKMILDSWKRLYSNTPASNFSHALKGLWTGADIPNSPTNEHFEGFDAEGYSIFFIDYKYPEENTVNFIVMNKVGGFLQRIDYVRKHAFAAICILKDPAAGVFPIRGLFIFRGQDIPPIMKDECYDVDLYNWTKFDPADQAQRQRAEAILGEDATIDGLENVEVKVFK